MKPNDNDPTPLPPADADEARVLAVLLGEASPFERETVEDLLARRPDLRAYRDRAAALLAALRDAAKPDPETPPARLDDARRDALLARLRTPTFRDRALGNIIAFSRPVRANVVKIAAVLAFLLVLSGLFLPAVGVSRKTNRAEARAPASEAFATGTGGGRDGEKEGKYFFRNREKAKDSEPRDQDAITYRSVPGSSDAEPADAISARNPAAPAAAPFGGAGGGSGGGIGVGRASGEMRSLFSSNGKTDAGRTSAGNPVLSGSATYSGSTRIAASDTGALDAASVSDRTPVLGDLPLIGKLSSVDTDAAKPKALGSFANGLTSGGMSQADGSTTATAAAGDGTPLSRARADYLYGDYLGALENVKDVLQHDPQSVEAKAMSVRIREKLHDTSRRYAGDITRSKLLEEVDGKWAMPEAFDKTGDRAAAIRDASDFPADSPAKGAKSEVGAKQAELRKSGVPIDIANKFVDVTKSESFAATAVEPESLELKPETLTRLTGQPVASASDTAGETADSEALRRYFRSVGIEFDGAKGTGLSYDGAGRLVVTQSPKNIERIQSILRRYSESREIPVSTKSKEVVNGPLNIAPVAKPVVAETRTADNAFSTFSLNVGDVSFRLAAQAARRGALPEASGVRVEEFVNAQHYRDPAPRAPEAVSLARETARDPFAHNRTLLRLSLRTGAEGRAAGTPLNLVVLLDDSGSMERADRREAVAAALAALADNLRPGDRVSVVGFSRDTRLLIDRMDGANPAPLRELAKHGVPAEGGTNLENALRVAYAQLASQAAPGTPGRILLLTDGAANLGDADPAGLAALVESNRARGRALDCFGVGFDGYNDNLLERLARKGGGRYAYLDDAAGAREELGKKLAGTLRPFAADVKVQVEFNPDRVKAWRLCGYDNHRLRKQDFRDNAVAAASLAAAESGTALYSLELKPDGSGDIGTVRVRYRIPDTQEYREREWPLVAGDAPAFDDAPEGVRTAAVAVFVAEALGKSPAAAGIDTAALRKDIAALAANRPDDAALADLRLIADRIDSGK